MKCVCGESFQKKDHQRSSRSMMGSFFCSYFFSLSLSHSALIAFYFSSFPCLFNSLSKSVSVPVLLFHSYSRIVCVSLLGTHPPKVALPSFLFVRRSSAHCIIISDHHKNDHDHFCERSKERDRERERKEESERESKRVKEKE